MRFIRFIRFIRGCESGQAFVGQVLAMAPIAIPVALGFAVLILTG